MEYDEELMEYREVNWVCVVCGFKNHEIDSECQNSECPTCEEMNTKEPDAA